MKRLILLFATLLMSQAIMFQSFEQALNYDLAELTTPECQDEKKFQSAFDAFNQQIINIKSTPEDNSNLLTYLEQLQQKLNELQTIAQDCNINILNDLQNDQTEQIEKQLDEDVQKLKHKIIQKHKNQVSFLQIMMDDEDVQQNQLVYQKQLLKNQGMLGFIQHSGKSLRLIQQ